jgi:squalene cyclase
MAFYFNDESDNRVHDGAFSNFGWKNETSVWLTSWVLIALKDATQAEWEEYNLFIDPRVRAKSSEWILRYQTPEGSWKEHTNILDREKFQVKISIELFFSFYSFRNLVTFTFE